jgi:polysaccharide biosynthesis/export protein
VQLSGGVTERGNKSATYVVHADGSVTPPIGWFNNDVDVGPGDTIVVPLKVDRVSSLKVATDVSQIIFQLAVAVAAMNAIGIF